MALGNRRRGQSQARAVPTAGQDLQNSKCLPAPGRGPPPAPTRAAPGTRNSPAPAACSCQALDLRGGQDRVGGGEVDGVRPQREHGPGTPLGRLGPCRPTYRRHLSQMLLWGPPTTGAQRGREARAIPLEGRLWDYCPSGPTLDRRPRK